MNLKRGEWYLVLFNLAYLIPFTIYYITIKNFEFLWYIVILVAILLLVAVIARRYKFSPYLLWGLSIWGLLHMAGGGVKVGSEVLYALQIVHLVDIGDTYILKYDQLIHGYLYFVVAIFIYELMKKVRGRMNGFLFYFVIFLASIGIGALNEIAEFMPVIFVGRTGVGGYANNMIDLIFNSLGALVAIAILAFRDE